jgi:two-component system response regulator WspF
VKIAIVHAQPAARKGLAGIIRQSDYQLAWCAADNTEAVDLNAVDAPDVILMDAQMDAAGIIRRILQQNPCPILMVTDSIEKHADLVFKAMGAGAVDAVAVPEIKHAAETVLKKIARLGLLSHSVGKIDATVHTGIPSNEPGYQHMVIIGCSSGGPTAVASLLARLPANYHSPVVVLQHINAEFAPHLATWLDEKTPLQVKIAQTGDRLAAGLVYIAASGNHLVMNQEYKLYYNVEPRETYYRPSVDVFFHSVAKHWSNPLTAILLTGMGRDGAQGLLELREVGAYTIAQDEHTSAVYGMPKAAARMGAAVDILPIQKISYVLNETALETAKQCKIRRSRGVNV